MYGKRYNGRRRKNGRRSTRKVYTRCIKNYRRKTYRKVKRSGTKWLSPISTQKFIKFVYCDTGFNLRLYNINSWVNTYVFRGNGPYDPDTTGVGVQPYGWDNYMTADMFNTYRCMSSSIKIYFRAGTNAETVRRLSCIVFPFKASASPSVTDISDLRMIPNHKETMYDNVTETTRSSHIKNYMSTKRMFRDTPLISMANAAYNAAPSAAYSFYWIVVFTVDGVNDDTDFYVYFDAKIKYYTQVARADVPNES